MKEGKTTKSYLRGHEIELSPDQQYRYVDTKEPTAETWTSRPCGHCGKYRTVEGHDGCLGTLPGVINACCGHGHEGAYLQLLDGSIVTGEAARAAIEGVRVRK